ncbi:MAG: LysM peptidoglycan-binding domain-containing protein [Bacteroidales bacterium]
MRKQKLTYIILLGFCLLFSGINAQSGQNRQSINGKEYIVYTVQPGEGLYGISKRHNVSQDAIISANPDMGNSLRSGQQILIPAAAAATASVQQEPDSVIVSYFMHEAKRKETLYGLSRKYNVSIDDLIKLNPGAKEKLKAKTLIRIPQYGPAQPKAETPQTVVTGRHHTIQPKETLFSVARLYGITINQLIESNPGLNTDNFQIGKTLIIPVSGDVQQPNETTNNGIQDETIQFPVGKKSVQATLFLPFNAAVQSKSDINQRRFTEFYEGMLLSVDSLKKMNYNVRLYVYDSYNQDPAALLRQQGVENSDLIIASPSGNQLQAFSDYAFKNKKSLILPFTSKNDEIDSNPFMVQINTPQVYLYDEVIQEFIRRFRNKQVIFLSQTGKTGNKNDFCDLLKQSLDKVGQNYITHQYLNTDIDMNSLTLEDGKEYIFVPENSTTESLKIYLPLLQAAKKVNPVLDITLFGYPEWQTYVKDYIEAFYVLNTYIYSPFYADNDSPGLNRFYRNFKNWYHKDILNSYPKFGALGFDTGFFFLQNYAVAGENGIKAIKGKTYNGIQTGFYFKPVKSGGGLINENIYFIHYSPEYLITKIQID